MDAGKAQIIIESEVDAALIYGDRLRGHERIVNHAAARAQIALNVVTQGWNEDKGPERLLRAARCVRII
ncbi:MAG: hypothetical protein ACLQVY_01405 [Limisphaerales bacterium]